jgi:A/G-specific adenine glycosylase
MLQQTQVAAVIPYYKKWLRRFPNFASLERVSQNDVLRTWEGLGYYSRARNLHATARIMRDRHRGTFPDDIAAIRKFPGVGRYTANAVGTFAFNQPVAIVEANSSRVLARLFDVRVPTDSAVGREKLWQSAAQLVPRYNSARFNSALIDLGALVCLSNKPKCNICPVRKFCRAKDPEALPIKKSKIRTKRLVEKHVLIVRNSKVLLERSRARWRGMWIFPRLETSAFGQPLYESTFPFTHHRITLAVYRQVAPRKIAADQRWFKTIDRIAMPSPHRRAADVLVSKLLLQAKQAVLPHRQHSSE